MNSSITYYPLTHPQKGIWYTEKIYPGTSIGNIAGTLRIKGKIDYELLEKAINIFIEKNDAMRLRIVEENGEPKQYVSEYTYRKIDFYDFSDKGIEELYKWDEHQTRIPFNLIDSDLFYFALIKISENEGGVYGKLHHLISDAWAHVLGGNKILEYYVKLKEGIKIDNEEPSYVDYIKRDQEYEKSDKFNHDKEYWHKKFETFPEFTTLKPRTTNYINPEAKRKTFIVPKKLMHKLHHYCKENKTTVFSLFLSALSIYVNRVTGKEDIVIGTTVLNRINAKEKNTMGMFISTIPVRINLKSDIDFKTFIRNITKEWMNALRYQRYPNYLLQKEIREKYKNMIYIGDILIFYQNAKFNKDTYGIEYETRNHFCGYQSNSLTIQINDREERQLIIDYDYLTDLFHAKEIEFIHQHIINLLWHGLDNPNKEICKLEMLSEKEKHKILYEFNNTEADYPRDKVIHQLFEEQVEKTPDNIAVVFEDKHLTYRELNEKSNQLARVLRKKGVKPDDIVAIMVNRSLEMIIGILGILKSGGAYLPIDPEYPEERIRYILEDSGVKILLTEKDLIRRIDFKGEVIDVKDGNIYKGRKSNLNNVNKPNDLIYVIYTSGSTGKPKGVMIEHRSVVNLSNWFNKRYSLDKNKNVINNASFSFDVSVEEIVVPLLNGGTVFIPKKEIILNKDKYVKYLNENKINIAQFVPSHLKELLTEEEKIESLNIVICGGEPLNEILKERIVSKGYKLYNHYGPTEITVDALVSECSLYNKVTLGRPIDNVKCYILDKYLNLQPIGMVGELYISGPGLARGYLNNYKLTEEKFISNPFKSGEKLYRTGDLVRWYPEGEIEYLGRVDHQVKIRGHRIELYEVKLKLLEYKGIKEVVVIDKLDKEGRKYLCAYIISDKKISISDLRTYLLRKLPDYMVPSYFVFINEMPLESNGKIDIKALREMDLETVEMTKCVPPKNEIEEKLTEIFKEVLKVDRVSIDSNFFELGGDSLDIIEIITKASLLGWKLKVQDIYKFPTIRELSKRIIRDKKK